MAKAQAKAKRKKRSAQSPSRYRAAIIGCGSMAGSHARGYSGVDAIDLVAGADPDEARGQRFSREFGVPKIYGTTGRCWTESALISSVCALGTRCMQR